jgi:hypothetical protein
MYFNDLELLRYHTGPLDAAEWAVPLLAVGWLEHPHPFSHGVVPATFVTKLADLVSQTKSNYPYYLFRGIYDCTLCAAEASNGPNEIGWSQENLIIPGEGEVFAAPGGIVHYISDHSYCPPASFLKAILCCPPSGSSEYHEKLRLANASQAIPLITNRQIKAQGEAHARFRTILGTKVVGASREQIIAAARQVWPESSILDADGNTFLGEAKQLRVTFDRTGHAIAIEIVHW